MTKSRKFKMQSAGAAKTIEIGFTPDTVVAWNLTSWETDSTSVKFYWHKGMTAGYALTELCEDSSANRAITTSNGFTPYSAASVNDAKETITGSTQANPCVLTVSSTSGWKAGNTVRIKDVAGMTELNGNLYKIKEILTSTTLSLDVDASGFSAYTSAGTIYNVSVNVQDSGFTGMTLGTTIMGSDDDIIMVEATCSDEYVDLGDLA